MCYPGNETLKHNLVVSLAVYVTSLIQLSAWYTGENKRILKGSTKLVSDTEGLQRSQRN